MADKWFAECIPCGWQEPHDDQGDAIRAAEDHVYGHHRDVLPHVRGELKIGHVQNRTVNAVGTAPQTSPDTPTDANRGYLNEPIGAMDPASTVTASEDSPNPNPGGE